MILVPSTAPRLTCSFYFSWEWGSDNTDGDLSTSILLIIKIAPLLQDISGLQMAERWKIILGKSLCNYYCPIYLPWHLF